MTTANKTFLGSVHRNQPEQYEAVAGGALSVGMLGLSVGGELIAHNSAGAGGFVYVVKERTAIGTVDETYTAGDWAQSYIPESGEMYRMLVATGQTVNYDTPLTSNGAGLLRVGVPGTDVIVCYSDEQIGATSGTTAVRIKFK